MEYLYYAIPQMYKNPKQSHKLQNMVVFAKNFILNFFCKNKHVFKKLITEYSTITKSRYFTSQFSIMQKQLNKSKINQSQFSSNLRNYDQVST